MLNILVFILCVTSLSAYFIRLESPTSNHEQRLLLTPQLQETYQIHPQQIVPLYRFQYPNQQILYYNPQTIQSANAELQTINPQHFNQIVTRIDNQNSDINNDAITIENPEFQAKVQQDDQYYVVDDENPPVFYGNVHQPASPIFSLQQLQPVARNKQNNVQEKSEKSSMSSSTTLIPSTSMRIVVQDEEEKEYETSSSSSTNAEEIVAKKITLREEQAEEMKQGLGDDGSIASAKPSGIALAGEGGVASSKPRATAVTGDNGYSVASPSGTAIAGDYSELLDKNEQFVNINKKPVKNFSTSSIIKEYRKQLLL